MLLGDAQLVMTQDLTQRKAAEERITYLECYDPLTQLPNRRQLLMTLRHTFERQRRRKKPMVRFCCWTLTTLKPSMKSKAMNRATPCCSEVANACAVACKKAPPSPAMGMIEFVVLLDHLSPAGRGRHPGAERMGQRILEVFRAPFYLERRALSHHCQRGHHLVPRNPTIG